MTGARRRPRPRWLRPRAASDARFLRVAMGAPRCLLYLRYFRHWLAHYFTYVSFYLSKRERPICLTTLLVSFAVKRAAAGPDAEGDLYYNASAVFPASHDVSRERRSPLFWGGPGAC